MFLKTEKKKHSLQLRLQILNSESLITILINLFLNYKAPHLKMYLTENIEVDLQFLLFIIISKFILDFILQL